MKKKSFLSTFGILIAAAHSYAYAAGGSVVMSIEFVGAASSNHPIALAQSNYSTGFNYTTQLGACPLVDGKVYFENPTEDKGIYSTLLSAKATGNQVKVYWYDTQKNSRNYCEISGVRFY